MSRQFREVVTVCSALAFLAAGCASFRGGELAQTKPWPPAEPAAKKSLSLAVTGSTLMNEKPGDATPLMLTKWRESTEQAYKESNQFSTVLPETAAADIRAEVKIVDSGNPNVGLAFISGLTMTLIPAKATDNFAVHTDFKNAQGDVLASIERRDHVDTWIQLFMVFVMPFNWPNSVITSTVTDLSRATIVEAHEKGVF